MTQFLLILGFQVIMLVAYLITSSSNNQEVKNNEVIEEENQLPPIVEVKIISKSDEVLGIYDNNKIHKYILLDTLEVYEYDQVFDGVLTQESVQYLIFNNMKYLLHSKIDNIEQLNQIPNK